MSSAAEDENAFEFAGEAPERRKNVGQHWEDEEDDDEEVPQPQRAKHVDQCDREHTLFDNDQAGHRITTPPVYLPTLPETRERQQKSMGLTFEKLPCWIITSAICPFLQLADIWRLGSVSRILRVLFRDHNFGSAKATDIFDDTAVVERVADSINSKPPFELQSHRSKTSAERFLIGHRLFVRTVLYDGVDPSIRHRLWNQMTELPDSLMETVVEELQLRSQKEKQMKDRRNLDASGGGGKEGSHEKYSIVFCEDFEPPERFAPHHEGCCRFAEELLDCLQEDIKALKESEAIEDGPSPSRDLQCLEYSLTLCRALVDNPETYHHEDRWADYCLEFLNDEARVSLALNREDDIRRDITRTFPSHPLFKGATGEKLKESLFRLLRATAIVEPGMGYCQGMNFIAATFLSETLCPTTSFRALLGLLRHRSLSGVFSPGVAAMRVRLYQFRELTRVFIPSAYAALRRTGFQTDLVGHQCFVTAMSYYVHPSNLIKFWDAALLGGNKVLVILALSILSLMEPNLQEAGDSEHTLRNIQTFRVLVSRESAHGPEGRAVYRNLRNIFLNLFDKIPNTLLARLSAIALICNLRTAVRTLETPWVRTKSNHNQATTSGDALERRTSDETVVDDSTGGTTASELGVEPPFLLVPRFQCGVEARSLHEDDVRAIIVNFVTKYTAKHFQLQQDSPLVAAREPVSTQEEHELVDERPPKISWSLLASYHANENYGRQNSNPIASAQRKPRISTVRGRGALDLSGFYLVIDSRYYLDSEEPPKILKHRLMGRGCRPGEEEDALTAYLFRDSKKRRLHGNPPIEQLKVATCREIAELLEWSEAEDCRASGRLEADDFLIGERPPGAVPKLSGSELGRRLLNLSNELLTWMTAHNGVGGSRTLAGKRPKHSEGFLIIPLRSVLHLKMAFEFRDFQLSHDRQHFENKLGLLNRQINDKIRQIDRLKAKHSQTLQKVADLETYRHSLSEAVEKNGSMSRSRGWKHKLWMSKSFGRSKVSESPQDDELGEDAQSSSPDVFQSPVVPSRSSRKRVVIIDTNTSEASPENSLPETGCHPSRTMSSVKTPTAKTEDRKLRSLEKTFEQKKAKLNDLTQLLAFHEESLAEVIAVKSALSQTYHEMNTMQDRHELEAVEDALRASCSWSREPLPLTLLLQAGIASEASFCGSALRELPSLYTALISLPLSRPQLDALFNGEAGADTAGTGPHGGVYHRPDTRTQESRHQPQSVYQSLVPTQ